LGGHSLLAVRILTRTSKALRVDLSLRDLLEDSTIAGFAVRVDLALRAGRNLSLSSLRPSRDSMAGLDRLPISFGQRQLWLLDQLEPTKAAFNLPAMIRRLGRLSIPVLKTSLNEILRRHEALRTRFPVVDGEPIQEIIARAQISLPVVDLSGLNRQCESVMLGLARCEASRPFDLVRGLPVRGLLLRISDEDWALLLTMHHIVSDAWSLGVLLAELNSLYETYANGRPSMLPELEFQYADFVRWQWSRLTGSLLDDELEYWREQLRGISTEALNLQADRSRSPGNISQPTQQIFELSPD